MSNEVPTPENKNPILCCERCKTATPHTFGHKERATTLENDNTKNLVFVCDVCSEPRRYGRERE